MSANDIEAAKQEARKILHPNSNIVGIGIGKKTVADELVDCVRVYVVAKLDEDDLLRRNLVPKTFLDVPSDVIQVGKFGSWGRRPRPREETKPVLGPGSRIRVKTNAPNVNEGAAGTLGAVVTDGANDYIVSCNHVLAANGRVPQKAVVIWAEFVGQEEPIATPGPFVPLEHECGNSVDCGLARLNGNTKKSFPGGFALSPDGPVSAAREMKVAKIGAATFRTDGIIVDVDADLYIDYSFGTFLFEHQVMIDGGCGNDFARAGDSGSMVFDTATNRPTALIFAASGQFAVACPLSTATGTGVLDKLGHKTEQPLRFLIRA